ncbi:phosphate signaling complex protein PhoU [Salimicrobium halophilum]|uniref:Phosphate-specific transport system accessory protein PhoU n=1 Tax=Salimicrobium halophilum TaxID=86666 RepID=A0A1G8PSL6_9BACI|nr:phosphate signaling complex protein PhoU [Salimicrobium halophilum]SDI95266.1 phosphate uptake regulator, PhoU [Salimicrobium halophilum]
MRQMFEDDLKEIKMNIEAFAEEVKTALIRAVDCLYEGNVKEAGKIIEDDAKLDERETEINEKAILLIAKQQPVAKDLRRLIVALRIATDLERMGDHARNVAKATIQLGDDHGIPIPDEIDGMKKIALEMVDTSMTAFEYEDISIASKLADVDNRLDDTFGYVVKDLLNRSAVNTEQIQHIMQVSYIARYIERFGDHVTNIGESVLYLNKGKMISLND